MISQNSLKYFAGAVAPSVPAAGPKASSAYLSHAAKDRKLASGLQAYLIYHGWMTELKWDDGVFQNQAAGRIAANKKQLIGACRWFLYLATEHSELDHWCQWELTLAQGVHRLDRIVVIPTGDGNVQFGERHLILYRFMSRGECGAPFVYMPGRTSPMSLHQIETGQ